MKPLILIVEDDPNILEYLKITLEYNECQVITAENGKKGLKVLSELEDCPDLIISDIMMPEMDGYSFFDAVSNDPVYYHVPFIFLSALVMGLNGIYLNIVEADLKDVKGDMVNVPKALGLYFKEKKAVNKLNFYFLNRHSSKIIYSAPPLFKWLSITSID